MSTYIATNEYGNASCNRFDLMESSLCSLNWLQEFNCTNGLAAPATFFAPVCPRSPRTKRGVDEDEEEDTIDWKSESSVKPPYSYAYLIYLALKSTDKPKLALCDIYDYITSNYAYYRTADPGWKNSIRHNLSQNKCFVKVSRTDDEPGKGGFWRVDPTYKDVIEEGILRKRNKRSRRPLAKNATSSSDSPQMKRKKSETISEMDEQYLDIFGTEFVGKDLLDFSFNQKLFSDAQEMCVPTFNSETKYIPTSICSSPEIDTSVKTTDIHPWDLNLSSDLALLRQRQNDLLLRPTGFNDSMALQQTNTLNCSLTGLALTNLSTSVCENILRANVDFDASVPIEEPRPIPQDWN